MKRKGVHNFYWQKGYGAFSIGQSQVAVVSRYIGGQKEHHANQNYKTEFRSLCEKYQVEIDERYVWE
jgi:putative transposase